VRSRAHDDLVLELAGSGGHHYAPGYGPTKSLDDLKRDRLRGMIEVRRARVEDRQFHKAMPYVTERDVAAYASEHGEFRPQFEQDLATWYDGMKILDGGAGEGRFFAELAGRGLKAQMVAVGIKKPKTVAQLPNNVSYLEGQLGADTALEARLGPGTYDRIVDTLGAATYSHDLGAVLGLYGRLLKPGGKVYIAAEGYLARFRRRDGSQMTLADFASMLKGFRVEYVGKWQLALVRTDEPLELPRTRLIGRASPLDRLFRILPPVAAH